jgi:ubiquinol-cytochrome c reductase cytochrome c1 subunit
MIMARIFMASMLGAALMFGAGSAQAAGGAKHLPARDWSFDGIFASFDRAEVQRGLQVYLEICANCHGLEYVAYRDLGMIGYDEDQIKAIAAEYEVEDGPDDEGEMFMRPARPADRFVSPYPNTKYAAAMNNGSVPPDLSLMYKARADGANYLHALLTGFEEEPPEDFEVMDGLSYNPYFPGGQIAMAQPLWGDDVEYADGTEATIEQEAHDVTAFLAWAAEPNLEHRKGLGLTVLLFVLVMTGLFYASKRKVWSDLH